MLKLTQRSFLLLCVVFLFVTGCQPVQNKPKSEASVLTPLCIASQSQCEVSNDKLVVAVKFSQYQLTKNIKTELPVYIELTILPVSGATTEKVVNSHNTSHSAITQVTAYLEGRDMFMGKVPVFFDKKEGKDVYLAETLLASCAEEQMVWRLWITAEIDGEAQTFSVDFTSQRL